MNTQKPPKWASRFLHWYCDKSVIEEIEGDALELFYLRIEEQSYSFAKRKYVWDVLRFLRWSNIKKLNHSNSIINTTMLQNYFKIGFRNIRRNKVPSAMNIFGLAVSIACAIVFFVYVDWNLHKDGFHEHKDDTYQIISHISRNGNVEKWGISPIPIGAALINEHSSVHSTMRIDYASVVVKNQDDIFRDRVMFVDDNFMDFFSFQTFYGDQNALKKNKQIVITDNLAMKYFGDEMPVGKQLTIIFNDEHKDSFTVGAVIDVPDNSSFKVNILVPFQLRATMYSGREESDWDRYIDATFVRLKKGESPQVLTDVLAKYTKLQNEVNAEQPIKYHSTQQLSSLSQIAYNLKGSISTGQHPVGYIAIGIVVLFLLLLAATNYLNIAVSSTSGRLKEIALRKTIGGNRRELVLQFIIENFILCSLSVLVGVGVAYYILWPAFTTMVPGEISFGFSNIAIGSLALWGLLLFVVLVSGLYPALYISSFQAVQIFSGKSKFGSKGVFSKILLSFQFLLAFILVVLGIRFAENKLFFQEKNWGYEPENVVVMRVDKQGQFESLANELSQQQGIVSISGSKNLVGTYSWENKKIIVDAEESDVIAFEVEPNYLPTIGVKLIEGRLFNSSATADTKEVVINEELAELNNWIDPVGKTLRMDSTDYYVAGLIKNFHYLGFYEKIEPVLFQVSDADEANFLTVRTIDESTANRVEMFMNTKWRELDPDQINEAFHQKEVFRDFFESMSKDTGLTIFISLVAIFLAGMGLFGTISYNIAKRMKEFSIKRVLGANHKTIFSNLSQDIKWVLLVAMCLGIPISLFLTTTLIKTVFPVYKPLNGAPFVVGLSVVLVITLLSVGLQIGKVLRKNPTELLRNE